MTHFERNPGIVDLLELKQLLAGLADNPWMNVGFRYRLSGQRWCPHFTKVLSLTDTGATVVYPSTSEVTTIQDLLDIVQFEIDYRFQNYQPHFHYLVRPLSAVSSKIS